LVRWVVSDARVLGDEDWARETVLAADQGN
jgi:hypothetical protein